MPPILSALLILLAIVVGVLVIIYVAVPLLRFTGLAIVGIIRSIGWLIRHVAEFIGGMIGDLFRAVGAVLASLILAPLALLNVIVGRWSGAAHYAASVRGELGVLGGCAYRVLLRRPLRLFWLHGLLEGIEHRVPAAMAAAPGPDRPRGTAGQFDGYTIVGSLPSGGSGARLYIAEPDATVRRRFPMLGERAVIKSFMLAEGSSLPQIVRESRALECAKQLGLVFEHGMDDERFWYVMPYHPGDHMGIVIRALHGRCSAEGLETAALREGVGYARDLLRTLASYHDVGLWHKDVKPENLIVHGGAAHLVDLGLVTPLRSAMTLTTHGTEYFRDPEMVRLALKGVKVHEVNGAKFDIYAAGAVLYFILEGEFPAHGALSRFAKRSPESAKWIVRRAMADYTHRYESAEAMLGDIEALLRASDPFAVRPADLPSVRSAAAAADPAGPDLVPERSVAAMPIAAGVPDPRAASVSPDAAPRPGSAAATSGAAAPRLVVTNWWSGAYGLATARPVDSGVAGATPVAAPVPLFPRPTAVEQRASARRRVEALQARARRTHAVRAPGERAPSPILAGLAVVAIVAVVIFVVRGQDRTRGADTELAGVGAGILPARAVRAVLDGVDLANEAMRAEIDRLVERSRSEGIALWIPPATAEPDLVAALDAVRQRRDREARGRLERIMEDEDLYGLMLVRPRGTAEARSRTSRARAVRLDSWLIQSEVPGAEQRGSFPIEVPVGAGGRYLLVVDHPTALQPAVQRRIDRVRSRIRLQGASIVEDESLIPRALSLIPRDASAPGPLAQALLMSFLAENGLSGVIVVGAGEGDVPGGVALRVLPVSDAPQSALGSSSRRRAA
ncbi:MAG: hypothetical protein KF817_08025 [Phycisphaeraceae bacterium]|nr:hypothetical protein [Phycisphaeraceae bacterium]